MKLNDLKKDYEAKLFEFETAMEAGMPHAELLKLYKELKELQFQLVQQQNKLELA